MKVILATFLYDPSLGGGAAAVVNHLAHSLKKLGIEVVVITSAPNPHPTVETIDNIRIWKFYPPNLYWVYDKDSQPGWKKIIWQLIDTWNPFAYQVFKRILLEENADIVHVHKLRGLSPAIWSAAKAVSGSKLVHTCHDFEIASPEGLFMGRVGQWARDQAILLRPYQSIRRKLSNLVDTFTAPSQFLAQEYKRLNFFQKAKCTVIPNTHGMEDIFLEQQRERLSFKGVEEPVKFLYLGRLDRSKGISVLLNAFKSPELQKLKVQLTIAGYGAMEDEVRMQTVDDCQIKYVGAKFGQSKFELLTDSDVVVVPSLAPESFGISAVEAFAYGLPVIAATAGGLPEVVNQKTGWLFETGNVSQLVDLIQMIAGAPNQIVEKQANCIKDADQYTIDKFVTRFLSVYRDDL